jgi:hypothetical protein
MIRKSGFHFALLACFGFASVSGCTKTSDGSIEFGAPKLAAPSMPSFKPIWPFGRADEEAKVAVFPPPVDQQARVRKPAPAAPKARKPTPQVVKASVRKPKPAPSTQPADAQTETEKRIACKNAVEVDGRVKVICE